MRRKDREMPKEFAIEVADKCEWATLAMTGTDQKPYCVPITIVRNGNYIYFHSAMDGYKIECLKANNKVCIVCVGDTHIVPDEFTTEYESAIINGTAEEITDDEKKIDILKILCLRHSPTNMENFDQSISRSLKRTAIWQVAIDNITGKRKKYDEQGKEMKFGRIK